MIKLISGSSNPELAREISDFTGVPLTLVKLSKFKDGERYVKIEENVRGCDVFIIQSTCCPANDNLMELLLLLDAAKRASANSVTAVIPYFGYARQDRMAKPREPISAKVVANMIQTAGADKVLTVDLHARQLQGFFDIPVDDLWAAPLFASYFSDKNLKDAVIVAPDAGGVVRARHLAKKANAPVAVIDKRREEHNECDVFNILGDVENKTAILLDDMIDTGGTISKAANAVREAGAAEVFICATHGVLSDNALKNLKESGASEAVITNTIPVESNGIIKVVSIAPLLGTAIKNMESKKSVSELRATDMRSNLVLRGNLNE